MKNVRYIKILLPIVIVIWGVLIYKVVEAFNSESTNIVIEKKENFIRPKVVQRDTFSLIPTDTDPFLGTVYAKTRQPPNTGGFATQSKIEIPWPQIFYLGIVADKKSSDGVYIVDINGQQYLLRTGDTIQKLRILKGSNEKLLIHYAGQTKEFPIM